jgi:hypothetical protein
LDAHAHISQTAPLFEKPRPQTGSKVIISKSAGELYFFQVVLVTQCMADILCRSLEFTSKKFSKSLPFILMKELEGGHPVKLPGSAHAVADPGVVRLVRSNPPGP